MRNHSNSSWVHIDFKLIRQETEKAFLLYLEDGSMEWFPKSQIADPQDYSAGDENGTISVTEWIAEQKGLL